MLQNQEKQLIKAKLEEYVGRFNSRNAASHSLKGVSSATVSQVLNDNWERINDGMWRTIAAQIEFSKKTWNAVMTRNHKALTTMFTDAQQDSLVFGIVGNAGSGKSFSARQYAADNKTAYLLQCNEYWNRKYFLSELLSAMGRDYSGLTVAEMMEESVKYLKRKDTPLIILDEADKLSDPVLYFFITIYNQLEDQCGIILLATDHLKKRLDRGISLNKKGYKEIFSRLGRKFIELKGVSSTDITQICMANGLDAREDIKTVIEDSEADLRRVKRKIYAVKSSKDKETE